MTQQGLQKKNQFGEHSVRNFSNNIEAPEIQRVNTLQSSGYIIN